jgi:predicted RND superfamily exporter protein
MEKSEIIGVPNFELKNLFEFFSSKSGTPIYSKYKFQVILALSACIVPLMACISAFGLSFLLGLRFSPIIAVTPFLVLAIGVDDSFIMTFKLHQLSKQTLTVEEKITKVCTETGPSVCLSSVTNILAFLIGSLNATPEIQLFNIVNAIALTIDLIYSLTLYAAILTLYAQQNDDSKKSHIDFESCWRIRIYNRLQIYLDRYIKFLSNTWVSISIVMAIFLFCSFTLRGALNMDVNLRSDKFFLEDSKLLEADNLKQQYVTPTFTSLIIIVNHPGNLTDPKRTARLEELVSYLETLPTAIGPDSTKFFLRVSFFKY